MNRLQANVAANFGGSLIAGLMGFLFIPVYIRLMGIEPYGLVGFFLTMQTVLGILDAGMSTTINREFARFSLKEDGPQWMRRLLRTFEPIYWGVGLAAGVLIVSLSRFIAVHWVQPRHLSIADVTQAVLLMGISFLVQWPLSLYSGGLQGLQQQVRLNVIGATAAISRALGAVAVLTFISPTVQAYFAWQIVVGALHTIAVALTLWHGVGGTKGARFDPQLLRSVWHFAASMMAISLLSATVTQLDKLILSRALPLAAFGYYAVAGTVAASLYRVVMPIFSATFPRFAQCAAENDERELAALFHGTAQATVVVVAPAAVFIAFFSREVMLIWTGDAVMAANTFLILSFLIMGTAMNGIFGIHYAVQLAYGWTRMVIVTNVIAVVFLIPAVLFLALHFGAPGAAFGWLAYNALACLIVPVFIHRRVLRGQLSRWYFQDVGAPLASAVLISWAARAFLPPASGLVRLLYLGAAAALVQLGAILAAPPVRHRILVSLRGLRTVRP